MKPSFFTALTCLSCLISFQLSAQTAADALRYSLQDVSGTARFVGAGGAFTALGADYGAISVNPAGAAMYRRDEFVVSTGMRFLETNTVLNGAGDSFKERRSNFNLDALGLVFQRSPRRGKWTTFNTILGYNRTTNFSKKYYYEGAAKGSLVNSYYDDAIRNAGNLNPFGSQLAQDANAIYPNTNGALTSDFEGNRDAVVTHKQYISERGGGGELHFGFAGNYKERLMIGITAGVPLSSYTLNSLYDESDEQGTVEYFNKLNLTESLRTEVVGFNLKFGMIYRATQSIRIGAAFHTPSFLSINDSYNTDFTYAYEDGSGSQTETKKSPEGLYDYKLNTPFRASFGLAYLFGGRGFLSADAEVVDYANAAFNLTSDINSASNAALERELNRNVEQIYQQTVNLRVGGELAHEDFRLRAGLQHLANPYIKGGSDQLVYSAGLGYRSDDFYLDLAFRTKKSMVGLKPYEASGSTIKADSGVQNKDFMLTLGFRF
jgi:hypothetical protein